MSRPFAACLRAGLAAQRGDPSGVLEHLRAGLEGAEAVGDGFRALAARYYLGRLLGGDEGTSCRTTAAATFEREKIRNPERLAATFIPGLRAMSSSR